MLSPKQRSHCFIGLLKALNVPTARLDILVSYNRLVSNLFQELRCVQQWIKERFDGSFEARQKVIKEDLDLGLYRNNPCNTFVKGNKGL